MGISLDMPDQANVTNGLVAGVPLAIVLGAFLYFGDFKGSTDKDIIQMQDRQGEILAGITKLRDIQQQMQLKQAENSFTLTSNKEEIGEQAGWSASLRDRQINDRQRLDDHISQDHERN